jgi:hypothetical protein
MAPNRCTDLYLELHPGAKKAHFFKSVYGVGIA